MGMSQRLLRPRASGAFKPSDITGLAMWLDANDSSTVTLASGAVSEWKDKAVGNVFAQTTANNRPGTTTVNGKTLLSFDGSNDTLSCADPFTTYPFSFFVVQQIVSYTFYGMTYTIGGGNNFNLRQFDTFGRIQIQYPGISPTFDETYSTQSAEIVSVIHESNAASSVLYRNGSALSPTGGTFSEPTVSGTHWIGTRNGSFAMNGSIGEIVVYSKTVNADERSKITNYLGKKWGITVA